MKSGNGKSYAGLGSIKCLDPVRDLSLDDYLSSGSIGSFTIQVDITCDDFSVDSKIPDIINLQVNVVSSYGGVLVTQQGSSSSMSGLLTKVLVLDTKLDGKAVADFETTAELQGGNIAKGLTSFRDVLKKSCKIANTIKAVKADVSGGTYNQSGGSKLSKYY